ncbi:uncharacterized protein LOC18439180 isoform X4 [Amborella trichopoda]|uniref:uncharacterized protein LOC18439180 isoform X4 n=1 Tax=Amborella trichopoda TaxID=13333 RepID=UPI0009C17940|nr:uncharacterized protein LOC18439180 isoform X4 [Amborella trichopoda]|eukprot:XP_020525969.1 uncharacterized protein LOC18439180 isoform X4 [Amborella trichopoda]
MIGVISPPLLGRERERDMAASQSPSSLLCPTTFDGVLASSKTLVRFPFMKNPRTRALFLSPLSASSNDSSARLEDGAEVPDVVKLALERAKAYKKSKEGNRNPKSIPNSVLNEKLDSKPVDSLAKKIENASLEGDAQVPDAVKMALQRAVEYRKGKRERGKGVEGPSSVSKSEAAMPGSQGQSSLGGLKERDEVEEKSALKDDAEFMSVKRGIPEQEGTISRIDFMGLDFSDKKNYRGLPPGLVPVSEPFPEGEIPDVEIIVGDTSKFGMKTETVEEDNSSDLYKPKVSTWGVFPRPSDISKTFGGGRVIRPGEVLETKEDKAEKQARTRQLLAAYKNKMGLNVDPKTKAECEKSELHGFAALQWSICQDSLSRSKEAQIMYEKLQNHPNVQVSKKARQFIFGFEAMEMMKISSSPISPKATGYQNYFEAFVEDTPTYSIAEEEDGALIQAIIPYIWLLFSPIILLAVAIAARKVI